MHKERSFWLDLEIASQLCRRCVSFAAVFLGSTVADTGRKSCRRTTVANANALRSFLEDEDEEEERALVIFGTQIIMELLGLR